MLSIRMDSKIEDRLNLLSKKTHRTKSFYVREALSQYLEDIEDYYLALEVLKKPGRRYSKEEVMRELDL